MKDFNISLEFEDVNSCTAFRVALEQTQLTDQPFRVALPGERLNYDNEFLTLILSFIEHDGLTAVAAFLELMREILKQRGGKEQVQVTHGERTASLSGSTTNEEINTIANDIVKPE